MNQVSANAYCSSTFPRKYPPNLKYVDCHSRMTALIDTINLVYLDIESELIRKSQLNDKGLAYLSYCFSRLIEIGQQELFKDSSFNDSYNDLVRRIWNNFQLRITYKMYSSKVDHLVNNSQELLWAIQYRESGFFTFNLPRYSISEIISILGPEIDALSDRYEARVDLSRENLSINNIPTKAVSLLHDIFHEYGVLRSLSAGVGCQTNVAGFAVELSVPEADWWKRQKVSVGISEPSKTAYFHRDETPTVPKAIIYLTEVQEDNGVFEIVPASFNAEGSPFSAEASRLHWYPIRNLKNIRSESAEESLRFEFESLLPPHFHLDSHFGYYIPDHSDESEEILNNTVSFCGSMGHGICFNGYSLLHRGGLVKKGTRLALQVMLPLEIKLPTDLELLLSKHNSGC